MNIEIQKRVENCINANYQHLDLSRLELTYIPDEIFEMTQLQSINLSGNRLRNISKNIASLGNLETIDFSNNPLSSLPREFSGLTKIVELIFINNKFKTIPTSIYKLTAIKRINFSGCKLTQIDDRINSLVHLEALWLYGNPLRNLPLTSNILNQLVHLGISDTFISDLSFCKELVKIEKLSVGSGAVTNIDSLKNLNSLKWLLLSNLPNECSIATIKAFRQLEHLYIFDSECQIYEEIDSLIHLKTLYISNCELFVFSNSLGNLKALEELTVNHCKLSVIPPSVGRLKELLSLNLSFNNISVIPTEISKLHKLKILSIAVNKLVSLPPELLNLHSLEELNINANDSTLVSPPPSTVSQGTEAILSYLKDLFQSEKVWSSKMILVGEGSVGKSCLLESLLDNPFNPNSNTTHGINIKKLSYPHPDTSCELHLNVWDFGGQDIYHATHQFYLTNHSLFLLVWNARAGYEAGKIYKWLEVIKSLAPESPIFVVATNSNPRGADLPKGDIIRQFGTNITFFEVDNQDRTGIIELREAIIKTSISLKYMGVDRPRSWINSMTSVENLTKLYLTKSEIVELFVRQGVSSNSIESLLLYLHDLGEVLYFPDEEVLKDTIIVNPEWVSKQIAKVLDSDKVTKNAGFLTNEIVKELWQDLGIGMEERLLALMEKFDLSYKTKDDNNISLVVEKLKFEEPIEYLNKWNEFNTKSEISFKYVLNTIPPGIPTWFIARAHRFSCKIHWRYGVVLQDEGKNNIGMVITSPERNEVWLKVRGDFPHYFFAQLRDTLELTFKRFKGLEVKTYVPCIGHNKNGCNYFFDLKQLEKRLILNKPKITIECPEAIEQVDVLKMLFGLSFAPSNTMVTEQISNEVRKIIAEENAVQSLELHKFIHLEFLKSYQVQQELMDITCPNLFILERSDMELLEKDLLFKRYKLGLCCQMPGQIHTVQPFYDIKLNRKWLKIVGPYYNKAVKLFKMSMQIFSAGSKDIIEQIEYDDSFPELETLAELAKILPNYKDDTKQSKDLGIDSNNILLRLLRNILTDADPEQNWGGLDRIITPEGHILWLCKEHMKEYKK